MSPTLPQNYATGNEKAFDINKITMIASILLFVALGVSTSTAFITHVPRVRSGSYLHSTAVRERVEVDVPELEDSNFRDVLAGQKAVLVDVYATWCGPCKLIEPTIKEAAVKHAKKVNTYKFNVESEEVKDLKVELALQGVMPRKLPSLILFHEGNAVASHKGIIAPDALDEFIESNLADRVASKNSVSEKQEVVSDKEAPASAGFVSFASHQDDDYMLSGLAM